MKRLTIAIVSGALWLTAAALAQAPPASTMAPANSRCPMLDKDGKCPRGRTSGQGWGMGRGPGRGRMAMRGGKGQRGPGPCMQGFNQSTTQQPQAAPKDEKK